MADENALIEYTVQVKGTYDSPQDHQGKAEVGIVAWRDLTTVSVPPRTKRKTVVAKALAQAGKDVQPSEGQIPLQIRVLGPEDARAFKVSAVVRDPELRIENA